MTAARWLPTFSLRALLAAVAVAAVVVATLLNATPNVKGAAAPKRETVADPEIVFDSESIKST